VTYGLFLAVAAGGCIGAPARFLIDRAVSTRGSSDLPWGTVAINVAGSFVLGTVTGLATAHGFSETGKALVGTGFCGAFTTFSTFSYESVVLLEDGRLLEAAGNIAGSLVIGLLAAGAGLAIGLA
jgi:CrcB protein